MKLNVELSPKSIQEAIKKLKKVKYQLTKGTLIKEYLEFVCEWVINRANWYLDNADLGDLVKLQIRNGWEYEVSLDGAKITNRTDKAVFVEFGVGIVGQENKHPNATESGYEYNIESSSKSIDGAWSFFSNTNELDLPTNALLAHNWYYGARGKSGEGGKRLFVMTKGAEGVMYAYNAIVDAQNELKNPNGVFAQEYKKLLERYVR